MKTRNILGKGQQTQKINDLINQMEIIWTHQEVFVINLEFRELVMKNLMRKSCF